MGQEVRTSDVVALRSETGAGVMACREALLECSGDAIRAAALLRERGSERLASRAGRTAGEGYVAAYEHLGRLVGVAELRCETDFVARNAEFHLLAHNLAQQVAATGTTDPAALLEEPWIRDLDLRVRELLERAALAFGEKLEVGELARVARGA